MLLLLLLLLYLHSLLYLFHIDLNNLKTRNTNVIQGQKYRISILTERLIRLEYSEEGKFNDLGTELVIYRNFEKTPFQIRQDNAFLEVTTNYFKLE